MTLSGELATLAQQGVQLWVEGGKLRIRAPKGAVTPAAREMLASRKDEIVELLRFQVSPDEPAVQADQGIVSGPVPLTPLQHSFLTGTRRRLHGPMRPIYVEVQEPVDPVLVEQAVNRLLVHHDALRMRFRQEGGVWRQVNLSREEHQIFSHVDIRHVPEAERKAAVKAIEREVKAEIDITNGPMIRVILITHGPNGPSRVLFVIHHLVMDFYSVSILSRDLETAYLQLRANEAVRLPAKTTSFMEWAERVAEYSNSLDLRREREYWLSLPWDRVGAPPVDHEQYRGAPGWDCRVQVALTAEETRAVTQDMPAQHGVQSIAVTLSALSQAYARWTGDPLYVDMLTHGRQPLAGDIDVTRTVGLFMSAYPAIVDLSDNSEPMTAVRHVHEQLKATPHGGIGYRILRDLACDPALIDAKAPRIAFNYRSHMGNISSGNAIFTLVGQHRPPSRDRVPAKRQLQWGAWVRDGRLQIQFTYHDAVYNSATMERLADDTIDALRSFIAAGAASA